MEQIEKASADDVPATTPVADLTELLKRSLRGKNQCATDLLAKKSASTKKASVVKAAAPGKRRA